MSTRALMDAETLLRILLIVAVAWVALQVLQWVISGVIATIVFVAQVVIAVGFVVVIALWLTDRI